MKSETLNRQADRIEWVLATHKAPARVLGGRVTSHTVRFTLTLGPATKVARVEQLAEEIALALGVSTARIYRESGRVHVEVPRERARDSVSGRAISLLKLCDRICVDATMRRAMHVPGTTLLGVASDGAPLFLRLFAPEIAHVLVSGTTGSGKTEAARVMLASLMLFQRPRQLQLVIVDPKGSEFELFDHAPHLARPIANDVDRAAESLAWLVAEMERRQQSGSARPRLVLLIDELADLLMQGGAPAQDALARLVQRGRSAGISVIACAQKPTSNLLGTLVKASFPARLVGKVTSAQEAHVAAGVRGTGAEKLAGRGDFLLVAGGETIRLQIAHLPARDYEAWRAKITAQLGKNTYRRPRGSHPLSLPGRGDALAR